MRQEAPRGRERSELRNTLVLSGNSARFNRIDTRAAPGAITNDTLAAIKTQYVAMGGMRSNARYGYMHRAAA